MTKTIDTYIVIIELAGRRNTRGAGATRSLIAMKDIKFFFSFLPPLNFNWVNSHHLLIVSNISVVLSRIVVSLRVTLQHGGTALSSTSILFGGSLAGTRRNGGKTLSNCLKKKDNYKTCALQIKKNKIHWLSYISIYHFCKIFPYLTTSW